MTEYLYENMAGHLIPWLEPYEPFGKLDPQVVKNRKSVIDLLEGEYHLYAIELANVIHASLGEEL